MKKLNFAHSKSCSIGVELELQILNSSTYQLINRAKEILEHVKGIFYPGNIRPEITQGIIELNTTIHYSISSLSDELNELKFFFVKQAKELDIRFSGGGVHPFQDWQDNQIYPNLRYQKLADLYGYLAKVWTIFGQHIHIGCTTGNNAIYLTHVLARYLPHFIALSAASPFLLNIDTYFDSVRLNICNALPTSGHIPFIKAWKNFQSYFQLLASHGLVQTMKDVHWDIRPKPEFGTVELRICDCPLTIEKAVLLSAYAQTLSHYLLHEKPYKITPDLYFLYYFNRFQAGRFGYEGNFIDPFTGKEINIAKDILNTLEVLKPSAKILGNEFYLEEIRKLVIQKDNDAKWLREAYAKLNSFPELMREQSRLWMGA